MKKRSKLPKIVHFLQFCADLNKKSKYKTIYLYPSERPHHAVSENNMFYRGLRIGSRDTEDYNIKRKADSAKI